ncbi:MAG TPA: M14 family zinc carboxypeptidase [Bdellovibrionota bacterium]|nr:M14 family zinc carboxypeptidase [Bdellovibrionota bacterium]
MGTYRLESSILCRSHLGRPVEILHRVGTAGQNAGAVKVLLVAAMHGDEPEGIYLMDHFLAHGFAQVPSSVDLYVIPRLNPDGVAAHTRVNGRGVDLNRNFPTADWSEQARADRYNPGDVAGSEIETQALMAWLGSEKPHFLINFHSWNPMVNYNGDCLDLAETMSRYNGCPVTSDMGYPTPGSSGTWFWEALGIPSITLEIQEGSTREQVESSGHPESLLRVLEAAAIKFVDS